MAWEKLEVGVEGIKPNHSESPRDVYLLQRKRAELAQNLGRQLGGFIEQHLKTKSKMLNGVQYDEINDVRTSLYSK